MSRHWFKNEIPDWQRALCFLSFEWLSEDGITDEAYCSRWKQEWDSALTSRAHQRRLEYLNPEIRQARQQGQRKYEKGEVAQANRKYRYENDVAFLFKKRLRGRIAVALRNQTKAAKTEELVGCSFDDLRRHLESKFQPGMSWANYGKRGWHVDHIKACYKFPDLGDPKQQRECFHFSNLQPLWWWENLTKDASESGQLRCKIVGYKKRAELLAT